jgi:hypothetical protein
VSEHSVTLMGNDVRCSCETWKASSDAWGPGLAKRLGYAHLARPDASTEELLAFVTERTA